jgi:hypothetical protein
VVVGSVWLALGTLGCVLGLSLLFRGRARERWRESGWFLAPRWFPYPRDPRVGAIAYLTLGVLLMANAIVVIEAA